MNDSKNNPRREKGAEPEQAEARPPQARILLEDHPKQYLIAPRRHRYALASGIRPAGAMEVQQHLSGLERFGLERVRPLRQRRRSLAVLHAAGGGTAVEETHVVRMHDELAHRLLANPHPQIIVEPDQDLRYADAPVPAIGAGLPPVRLDTVSFSLRVLGAGDRPLAGAQVSITSSVETRTGITNEAGDCDVRVLTGAGEPMKSLFVKPRTGHWTRNIVDPTLDPGGRNEVRVLSLEETIPGFPHEFELGWGQELMGLRGVANPSGGSGIKIGIIDSGLDAAHPCLAHVAHGVDLTNGESRTTWKRDELGHGTHCAGVIGARPGGAFKFRGFAPGAELHSYKVFPGGKFSALHDALDLAIHEGMDVISMSLGGGAPSEAIEQKLEEAVEAGIICIVAAGNAGGPVQYPASSANTVAVSAFGKLATFPAGTWDATQVRAPIDPAMQGFLPQFTCFGPQINMTAPGVAIVSTYLDGGFAPDSGTSMAAPHISGLAARLLAEHPSFQSGGAAGERNEARVRALGAMLAEACQRLPFSVEYVGHGLPGLRSAG